MLWTSGAAEFEIDRDKVHIRLRARKRASEGEDRLQCRTTGEGKRHVEDRGEEMGYRT